MWSNYYSISDISKDTSSHEIASPIGIPAPVEDDLVSDWSNYFPEPSDNAFETISNAMFGAGGTGSTMVDNLTPACKKLVDGIQDLLRYKEDAQITEQWLPELIKMLACKSHCSNDPNISRFNDLFYYIDDRVL